MNQLQHLVIVVWVTKMMIVDCGSRIVNIANVVDGSMVVGDWRVVRRAIGDVRVDIKEVRKGDATDSWRYS